MFGFFSLAEGDDIFTNNSSNSWNIRSFEATGDPLTRDLESVAISDFGSGVDLFTNTSSGAVRLLTAGDQTMFTAETADDAGATSFGAAGFDPSSVVASFPVDQARIYRGIDELGVEHGHIVNLETFDNAGLITMADAATGGSGAVAGDIFAITGNTAVNGVSGGGVYRSNGGQLHIDTVLNDGVIDDTDLFIVDTAVTGTGATLVTVNNAGGVGASTDINDDGVFDLDEGILVIQALESSSSDAFALSGPLIEGAFEYVLDQTDGQNWFLHSTASSMLPVYDVYPQSIAALNTLPTLQQRIGNRNWVLNPSSPAASFIGCTDETTRYGCDIDEEDTLYFAEMLQNAPEADDASIWTRVEAYHTHVEPQSLTTSEYDINRWKLQAGIDWLANVDEEGNSLTFGLNAFYGKANLNALSSNGGGTTDTSGYGLGATLTWYNVDGRYLDLQAQYGVYDSDLTSGSQGVLASDLKGTGYALSAEFGKKIERKKEESSDGELKSWSYTPQAQIMYSSVDFDTFTGPFSDTVSLDEAESLSLRLGVSTDKDHRWIEDGKEQRSHIYGIANLIYDFKGETILDVNGTKIESTPDKWTGEIGLGFTRDIDDNAYSIYGEVSLATGLENFGSSYEYGATFGIRGNF